MDKIIGIAGAGMMGRGIAQVAAMAGWEVRLYDIDDMVLDVARKHHSDIINMLCKKGRIGDNEAKEVLSSIYYGSDLNILMGSGLVIEAIIENIGIKKSFYQKLKDQLDQDTIVASNTSSFSITELASAYAYPQNFLGIHFFNPAPLMPLVEIVRASQTNDKNIKEIDKILSEWGKTTVITEDSPGFIVNKVARPYYSEALMIYDEKLANISEIDAAMESEGFKMGPFTLMDFIGHDVNYAVTESVWKSFYFEPRYQPALSQLSLVRAGKLGKKSGEGFYKWEGKLPKNKKSDEKSKKWISTRIIAMLINEAADTVQKGICSEEDVEIAVKLGVNFPKGLLEWGKEIGYDKVINTLDDLYEYYHDPRYRVSPYLRKLAR